MRVVIVGGGVAALECALALQDLAPELTSRTIVAPNSEFVMRPMTVREPFAYAAAERWPVAKIAEQAAAELISDELARVEPERHVIHLASGGELEYDALVIALGARAVPRYTHAITVDDRSMDEALHGLVQDVEGGYVANVVFLSPGRMGWPLPLYELALLTAARAYDCGVDVGITVATPESSPLAIFGQAVSGAVSSALGRAGIEFIGDAYAEVPHTGEVVINPGDRRIKADRVVALPELFGPSVRGVPLAEHGFIHVNQFGRVPELDRVFAAGDVTDFALKHGGASSQQADTVAESIAALAGADLKPAPFQPVIHGMLLTGEEPIYMTARITGGHGFSSEVGDQATWSPPAKIASRYLTPCLDRQARTETGAR